MKHRVAGKVALALSTLVAGVGLAGVIAPASAQAATTWRFSNDATGRFLDSNAAGAAYTLPGNGGTYQTWRWIIEGSYVKIQNKATGRCLDHNVALNRVTTGSCTPGNPYQNWSTLTNGLIKNRASSQCLDDNRALNRLTATGCDAGNPYRRWNQHLD
ncbi:RICIN domain-containing protein [Micromonospora chokoriensis]